MCLNAFVHGEPHRFRRGIAAGIVGDLRSRTMRFSSQRRSITYAEIDDAEHAFNEHLNACGVFQVEIEHLPAHVAKERADFEVELVDQEGLREFGGEILHDLQNILRVTQLAAEHEINETSLIQF